MTFDLLREIGAILPQPKSGGLRARARVGEHQRGPVLANQRAEFPNEALPGVAGFRVRILSQRRMHAKLDSLGRGNVHGFTRSLRSAEKSRHFVQRRDGGGEPDPLQRAPALRVVQPFQAQRQMGAALILRQRMNLIHDDPPDRGQMREPFFLAEQHTEALRRGEKDMGRAGKLPLALAAGGIARAQFHANRRFSAINLAQRLGEILLQVIAERPQRRYVYAINRGPQLAAFLQGRQLFEHAEERGKRLAGSRGRRDQHICSPLNPRPSLPLRRGRVAVAFREPLEWSQKGLRNEDWKFGSSRKETKSARKADATTKKRDHHAKFRSMQGGRRETGRQ